VNTERIHLERNLTDGPSDILCDRVLNSKELSKGVGKTRRRDKVALQVRIKRHVTELHPEYSSRYKRSSTQNISRSTETNGSHNNHIITLVAPNPYTTESEHTAIYRGSAELKVSTQKIFGDSDTNFENRKTDETEATVFTPKVAADITADNSAISNSFSQAAETMIMNSSKAVTEETVSHYWNFTDTQSTQAETDEPIDSDVLKNTSAHEPGAGSADDNTVDSPSINKTSLTTEPTGCSEPCYGQDQYENSWTGCPGSYVSRPCPNMALGEARWFCDPYGSSFVGSIPDYSNCTHMWIEEAQVEVSTLNADGGVLSRQALDFYRVFGFRTQLQL
jgi:hypothetical protein